jgi:hypothetical protein
MPIQPGDAKVMKRPSRPRKASARPTSSWLRRDLVAPASFGKAGAAGAVEGFSGVNNNFGGARAQALRGQGQA